MDQAQLIESFITRESYEADFMNSMERILRPGWICADVGACKGDYTLLMARGIGVAGKVDAFDIFPLNIEQVNQKLAQCGLSNVSMHLAAVTDGLSHQVDVHPGKGNSDFEWNIRGCDINGVPTPALYKVSATSLDDFYTGKAGPNVVKIDVEGAGGGVLRGMKRLVKKRAPIVYMESHDDPEWQEVLNFARERYVIWDLKGDTELSPTSARVFHTVLVPRA